MILANAVVSGYIESMNKSDPITRGLGIAIGVQRYKHQLGKDDLAEKLGVTPNAVYRWEMGKSSPPFGKIPALAAALGLTTPALVKLACKLGGCQ